MRIILKRAMMVLVLLLVSAAGAGAVTVSNLTFKDTDIRVVFQAIRQLAVSDGKDINIVPGPDVTGTVTIDLALVDWETALGVILKSYDLEASRQKNVIMVSRIGPKGSVASTEIVTKVFNLKFLDANDALKAIQPIISSAGKTSVLETTGQSGWEFGTAVGQKSGTVESKLKRTKILVVSDTAEHMGQISNLIEELDVMPKQVLIKTRILEVNHDLLKDLGVEWGTGKTGVTSGDREFVNTTKNNQIAAHVWSPTPSMFIPQTKELTTANGGGEFLFQHINGTQFEVLLHALEENSKANMLSAPMVMTLNNQEATILIGTKYPIIKTDVSTETSTVIGGSLQEYKDIGIQLNVVPQIWGEKENYINLIVHPAVSSYSTTAKVLGGVSGTTTLVEYPIIDTREAQTQLIIPDNGTVMMGGLIKDVVSKQVIGIPILSKIPFLGSLFKRTVTGTNKVELVIFITAHIMTPEEQVAPEFIDTAAIEKKFDKK